MTPEAFVDIFQQALYRVLIMVCAIVIPGLIVGLVVAVFQAATSINEQTLSFLPRLIATLLALMFFGHMMTRMLMDYFHQIIEQIPNLLY
ncbi:flagellar biosynthesis protein FliQ [Photobacterium damselae subsp. piscicida]|uniref:Flagellar biosynthetic protein FliQ n=1 Tax=Photobacterium damsela subsp. piscicida TaxID=38294 RepID=A0A1Q9H6I1_PHODP|nr:flagellar biosynthesis protein FliQ [Photobacterium damselae]MBE8129797.1 flagellar biosynthesis protein FliQ [Photobacterium damselae subsp. piscicida]MDP2516091.1 flagellar biosynthesis protein FliQ [Photobacterium damselae subsp. piscicida]MDP2533215.1 flagellar biosynthesis protein FliQ [Photobacterium damselae subsp. piscicida]MDP2545475.1 flagellar biosynthesis protein FliQ [Photobacterium damselae subsp. piscicida]MDP2559272.1 flagellar biosynthesis protein FliQ [Photobacterium damse